MHPVIRAVGKVLRLVGISSPEDALAKREEVNGPPSWRRPVVATAEPESGSLPDSPVDLPPKPPSNSSFEAK
jgi:hypothetical protein